MDELLLEYIHRYLGMVEYACCQMLQHFSLSSKSELLRARSSLPFQFEINGLTYMFHGSGCMAYSDSFFANWDFHGGDSVWCGIDPWFVARTIAKNKFPYAGRYTGEVIRNACEEAAASGLMVKRGSCYYFTEQPEGAKTI